MINVATSLASPALSKSLRGWAIPPNPFATARGRAARARTRRYQYTGQGLRVRKWTSSNTSGNTYFVYNENAQLIGEYDNAGARVQEIIWLGNLPIGVIAGTAATPVLHYIESDHLGTPRVIVEATRNVGIWRWNQTNDPFGESTPNQNPDGDATSFTFNLRFAGQYRDSESGWYYNVHRYYDPSIGRYLESDPIGLGGGISTYSYVGAAPLTAVDPLGLFEWSGTYNSSGASAIGFAGGLYSFELTSDCHHGTRHRIWVEAKGVGFGAGAKWLPVGSQAGSIVFDDHIEPRWVDEEMWGRFPERFNGVLFVAAEAGAMVGAGPSCQAFQFGIQGQPTISSGCAPIEVGGINAGGSVLWGRATVVKRVQEECGCEK